LFSVHMWDHLSREPQIYSPCVPSIKKKMLRSRSCLALLTSPSFPSSYHTAFSLPLVRAVWRHSSPRFPSRSRERHWLPLCFCFSRLCMPIRADPKKVNEKEQRDVNSTGQNLTDIPAIRWRSSASDRTPQLTTQG
jgi:hypothetical protein